MVLSTYTNVSEMTVYRPLSIYDSVRCHTFWFI